MTQCNLPVIPPVNTEEVGEVTWAQWFSLFNWLNWLGLLMFLVPIAVGYCAVHAWLWGHDLVLFYGSLYVQLGLLFMAWKQV